LRFANCRVRAQLRDHRVSPIDSADGSQCAFAPTARERHDAMSEPLARRMAELARSPIIASPSPAHLERAVTYALDTLAVTLAGYAAPSSGPMVRALLAAAGKPQATLYGVGRVTSVWDAALGNGALAHALELDDDHRIAVLHPGAVIVPAAFAVAEEAGASGARFLSGLLAGYEIACRLGEVFRGSQFYHGVHPTPLCGVFGAALAASTILDLDAETTTRALGVAGTQAAGLTEWKADGSWIKRLHPGRAAHGGVLAAYLAREGFTGPATIIEGKGGFFNAFGFGETLDVDAMTRDLGRELHGVGTAIKPYACCRFAHGAIDLAIDAHRQGIPVTAIERIAIRIYRTDVLSYHAVPINAVDAQFNLPYVVAVALANGAITLGDFTEATIKRPEILALTRRTQVSEDPEFNAKYPQDYWVELVLELRGGERKRLLSTCPSGDPEAERYQRDPGLLRREVRDKTRALLAETGFGAVAEELIAAVEALPDARDVTRVAALLGRAPSSDPHRPR
jgi:2-methylcitrate dehydratase PrpD